jgi:hypothetical protein
LPSQGNSTPSASTIFISTPGSGRPCFNDSANRSSADHRSCLAFSVLIVPTGLISVIPQPCSTLRPKSSDSVRTIAGGTAEPPIVAYLSVENLRRCCFMWAIRLSHTVGTPAELSTRSVSKRS